MSIKNVTSQLGFFGEEEKTTLPREFKVETENKSYTTVILGEKNPDLPERQKMLLNDLYTGAVQSKWWIKSALHKEIRRGNLQDAMRWSRWLCAICGKGTARTYCRGIVFEETRNVALYHGTRSLRGKTDDDFVAALTTSRKKAEVDARKDVNRVFSESFQSAAGKSVPTDSELDAVFMVSTDLYELFEMYWRVWRNYGVLTGEHINKTIGTALRKRAEIADFTGHSLAEQIGIRNNCHMQETLIEIFGGAWSTQAEEAVAKPYTDDGEVMVLPFLHDYVLDNHTRSGFTAYKNGLPRLLPGKPNPVGVDPRWSGMSIGVCWREAAYQQFGFDYVNKSWADVSINEVEWKSNYAWDRIWYPKMIR